MQSVLSRRTSTTRIPVEALARPGDTPIVALPFEFRVAGTGHDRRYSAIRRYATKNAIVRLTPEPTNPHDPKAIAVQMLWKTAADTDVWDHIGYVPAEFAPAVNELVGSGEWAIEKAYIRRVDASPELDAPRVLVRLEGKDLRLATD